MLIKHACKKIVLDSIKYDKYLIMIILNTELKFLLNYLKSGGLPD